MSVVDFPLPDRPIAETEIDKLHSEAFRDLESDVCGLDRMGAIAQDLIMKCAAREDSLHKFDWPSLPLAVGEDDPGLQGEFLQALAQRGGAVMKRRRRSTRKRNRQRLAAHATRLGAQKDCGQDRP